MTIIEPVSMLPGGLERQPIQMTFETIYSKITVTVTVLTLNTNVSALLNDIQCHMYTEGENEIVVIPHVKSVVSVKPHVIESSEILTGAFYPHAYRLNIEVHELILASNQEAWDTWLRNEIDIIDTSSDTPGQKLRAEQQLRRHYKAAISKNMSPKQYFQIYHIEKES